MCPPVLHVKFEDLHLPFRTATPTNKSLALASLLPKRKIGHNSREEVGIVKPRISKQRNRTAAVLRFSRIGVINPAMKCYEHALGHSAYGSIPVRAATIAGRWLLLYSL
jgi:hypothetical protein